MDTKRCTKCGEDKPLDAFSKRKALCKAECKACEALRRKAWREANPEKARARCKAWREANPEKARAGEKAWREANREKEIARARAYYKANTEKERAKHRAYYEENRGAMRARHKAKREKLTDYVVASLLRIPLADCTPELIQAKREQLLLHRAITNLKKEIANVE